MKFYLLPATILTLILFATIDLNAQTTVYYDWPASQLPTGPNDPLNLRNLLFPIWLHDEAASTATDKIYRATGDEATQGNNVGKHAFRLFDDMHIVEVGTNKQWDAISTSYNGQKYVVFQVNEDMNATFHVHKTGKDYLILTDQLMQGILTLRDITGQ